MNSMMKHFTELVKVNLGESIDQVIKKAGMFNKEEDVIELQKQHNRQALRSMFLEESAWKIFSRRVVQLDPVKV